ncbi:uncharacterized protein LOC129591609 [Paramacrobiotus metropolitanus]|uniref:uncharacterized protein LOC129591609 n=1 Tax=Paramacrobiotus metropolitanus TaxID=2943436 RepID=UPI0024457549|nr:uncharacterized protein LOC129591609 [Paramacrobiotus metropolitanus]
MLRQLRYLLHICVAVVLDTVLGGFRCAITILSVFRPAVAMHKVGEESNQLPPKPLNFSYSVLGMVFGDVYKALDVLNKRREEILDSLPDPVEDIPEATKTEWIMLLQARDAAFRQIVVQENTEILKKAVMEMLYPLREMKKVMAVDDWNRYCMVIRELQKIIPNEVLLQAIQSQTSSRIFDPATTTEALSDGSVTHRNGDRSGNVTGSKTKTRLAISERKAVVSPLRKSTNNAEDFATGCARKIDFDCGDVRLPSAIQSPTMVSDNGTPFTSCEQNHTMSSTKLDFASPYDLRKENLETGMEDGWESEGRMRTPSLSKLKADPSNAVWEPLAVSTPLKKPAQSRFTQGDEESGPKPADFGTLAGQLDNICTNLEQLSDSLISENHVAEEGGENADGFSSLRRQKRQRHSSTTIVTVRWVILDQCCRPLNCMRCTSCLDLGNNKMIRRLSRKKLLVNVPGITTVWTEICSFVWFS